MEGGGKKKDESKGLYLPKLEIKKKSRSKGVEGGPGFRCLHKKEKGAKMER